MKFLKKIINPFSMFIFNTTFFVLNALVYGICQTQFSLLAMLLFFIGMVSNAMYIGMDSEWYINYLKKKIIKKIEKSIDKE